MKKTNAIRIIESLGISYQLREYAVTDEHQSAIEVAEAIGESPEHVYKTLVFKGDKEPFIVAVIPSYANVDLKKLAKVSGNKRCEMLPLKELLSTTGYVRGGCSPIGMKKAYPTYIEELITLEEQIIVSAGKRGLQVILDPSDLISIVSAVVADIVE
ncbi:MAG: Cys-tRNA(Pro) deacylase [Porphyromonas sp.]|nr:Cys-tRNA(Pro) deacylase [Porphyromonas sp.]